MTDSVSIELSKDEALVLFEWLTKRDDADVQRSPEKTASFSAEDVVLLRVQGRLEKVLTDIFDPAYENLLVAARRRVLDG